MSATLLLGALGLVLACMGLTLAARWRRLRRTSVATGGRRLAARRAAAWPLRVLSLWLLGVSLAGVLRPDWPTAPYAGLWGAVLVLLVALPLRRGLRRRTRAGAGQAWSGRSTAATE
jgi:hypothetical protein